MVGAVLDKLEALNIEERTVVFFSGDNGPDGQQKSRRMKMGVISLSASTTATSTHTMLHTTTPAKQQGWGNFRDFVGSSLSTRAHPVGGGAPCVQASKRNRNGRRALIVVTTAPLIHGRLDLSPRPGHNFGQFDDPGVFRGKKRSLHEVRGASRSSPPYRPSHDRDHGS